jgi:hypothetical protein
MNSQYISTSDANLANAWTYQNFSGNGNTSLHFAWDDHFIQVGSFACVELWDTNDPATVTRREIQEPTSWSNTSITIRGNVGGFPTGPGYVVVLADSISDVVVAAVAVTVAAGG